MTADPTPTSSSAAKAKTATGGFGIPEVFDYLIERARVFFRRAARRQSKGVNYLLPHIQRVPSRIVRDELAKEISHRSWASIRPFLRQEFRHALREPAPAVRPPAPWAHATMPSGSSSALWPGRASPRAARLSATVRALRMAISIPLARRTTCSGKRLHGGAGNRSPGRRPLIAAHEQGLGIPCRCRWRTGHPQPVGDHPDGRA